MFNEVICILPIFWHYTSTIKFVILLCPGKINPGGSLYC
jgi:hypothetical protein